MKRQPSDWEKIFANKAMDKGIISKIHKQLMQFNIKKKNKKTKKNPPTQAKNGQKPKSTFLQRQHTDSQQTHEKMLSITNY